MKSGNFSLDIPEGKADETGYRIRLPHDTVYTIVLENRETSLRCDAQVWIDGKPSGTWRVNPASSIRLERPAHSTGRFTFYRAGTRQARKVGIIEGEPLNGIVLVAFRPEKRQLPALLSQSLDFGGREGGTGLSGKSEQTFVGVERIEYDEAKTTHASVLLVAEKPVETARQKTSLASIFGFIAAVIAIKILVGALPMKAWMESSTDREESRTAAEAEVQRIRATTQRLRQEAIAKAEAMERERKEILAREDAERISRESLRLNALIERLHENENKLGELRFQYLEKGKEYLAEAEGGVASVGIRLAIEPEFEIRYRIADTAKRHLAVLETECRRFNTGCHDKLGQLRDAQQTLISEMRQNGAIQLDGKEGPLAQFDRELDGYADAISGDLVLMGKMSTTREARIRAYQGEVSEMEIQADRLRVRNATPPEPPARSVARPPAPAERPFDPNRLQSGQLRDILLNPRSDAQKIEDALIDLEMAVDRQAREERYEESRERLR